MPEWYSSVFVMGAPLIEKIIRPIIVYAALVLLLRVFGKRELAQLNPFDLVVLLSLSNTVQNAIIGNDNSLTGGLVGALTLLAVNYLVVRFLFRHRRLDQLLEGAPTVLIDHGKLREKALASELMTHSELEMVLHRQGYRGVKEVERCVLEPGGAVSIDRKEPGTEELRHKELLARLDKLQVEVDALRRQ